MLTSSWINLGNKKDSSTGLKRLLEGNQRFSRNEAQFSTENSSLPGVCTGSEHPFAVIICCSGPCITPEIIFDQNRNNLFVLRTAGAVICTSQMDTLRFGLTTFNPEVILVLGHKNCAAVKAVVNDEITDIPQIAKKIAPAVEAAKKNPGGDLVKTAVKQNALQIKRQIEEDESIKKLLEGKHLVIKAAYYDPEKKIVEILK